VIYKFVYVLNTFYGAQKLIGNQQKVKNNKPINSRESESPIILNSD